MSPPIYTEHIPRDKYIYIIGKVDLRKTFSHSNNYDDAKVGKLQK